MAVLHVEEVGLEELKTALANDGEEYKSLLARIVVLYDETIKKHIQGDIATDFEEKFEAKRETFESIVAAIEKAQEYTGTKTGDFTTMITELKEKTH